ncbi:MAG: hypothetical protein AAB628_03475 [Patescibacteria group bacterium]
MGNLAVSPKGNLGLMNNGPYVSKLAIVVSLANEAKLSISRDYDKLFALTYISQSAEIVSEAGSITLKKLKEAFPDKETRLLSLEYISRFSFKALKKLSGAIVNCSQSELSREYTRIFQGRMLLEVKFGIVEICKEHIEPLRNWTESLSFQR